MVSAINIVVGLLRPSVWGARVHGLGDTEFRGWVTELWGGATEFSQVPPQFAFSSKRCIHAAMAVDTFSPDQISSETPAALSITSVHLRRCLVAHAVKRVPSSRPSPGQRADCHVSAVFDDCWRVEIFSEVGGCVAATSSAHRWWECGGVSDWLKLAPTTREV
jgi:hypothetical protein